MSRDQAKYWTIENYVPKPCDFPQKEFCIAASLHNHSNYSQEDLKPLDAVVELWYMRPFKSLLQRAFGLADENNFSYSDIRYSPPFTVKDLYKLESNSAQEIGFDSLILTITDHDTINGCFELNDHTGSENIISEELSIRFNGSKFHLGIIGLPTAKTVELHSEIQEQSRANCFDNLFDLLSETGCLVILNHPLLPQDGIRLNGQPEVLSFLDRYKEKIDALEINGMRSKEENDRVLVLARKYDKPVIGGGDCHSFSASPVLTVSRNASNFEELAGEIKSGIGTVLLKPQYFVSLRWRLFLRVLAFIAHYREIARYKNVSINEIVSKNMIGLDLVKYPSRVILQLAKKFHAAH